MRTLTLLLIGVLIGCLLVRLTEEETKLPEPVSRDCSVSENAADRCDRALLTCLSVQVRFIREMEQLQSVCKR